MPRLSTILGGFLLLCMSHAFADDVRQTQLGVELAGVVAESSVDQVEQHLSTLGVQPEVRENYFLDSDDRLLLRQNVILRVRSERKGVYSATVKVRPIDVSTIPDEMFSQDGFKCEIDGNVYGGASTACSLKVKLDASQVETALQSGANLWGLFNEAQKDFLDFARPNIAGKVAIRHFGPAKCRKWEFNSELASPKLGMPLELVVEEWVVGSRVLMEFSTRITQDNLSPAVRSMFQYFDAHQFRFAEIQTSKTAFVLSSSL